MRRAILAVLTLTGAATLLACEQEVTAAVPLDCGEDSTSVTVTATMPRSVPSGSAFALTIESAGDVRAVDFSLTNATPGSVTLHGTSTIQVVSTGPPGSPIAVDVAGARTARLVDDPDDPFDRPWEPVGCTTTGPTHVGSIATGSPQPGADAVTTPVDARFHTWCTGGGPGQPVVYEPGSSRVSVTVPTRVTPGETFTLPDLAVDTSGSSFYGVQVSGATVPTSNGYVGPSTPITVAADASGHVSLRFLGIATLPPDPLAPSCTAQGSGILATIPVLAAPG